jgi:hypothetical protein
MNPFLKLCALGMLVATPLFAVDLSNEDSVTYNIQVEESSTVTNASISPNTTVNGICSSCTIHVEGVGRIAASGSDRVVIRGGQISK